MKLRKCTLCKTYFPETADFFYYKESQNKYAARCSSCVRENTLKWSDDNREYKRQSAKESYLVNAERIKARARQWYWENPKRAKENTRIAYLRKLNMDPNSYIEKVESQSNKCAICDKGFKSSRDTHLDHDHVSGRVRDMLCAGCNTFIGKIETHGIVWLAKCIEYLKKHESQAVRSEHLVATGWL